MSKVMLVTRASRDTDSGPSESVTGAGSVVPSTHNHSGYPTAAIFHRLIDGGGPTDGVGAVSRRRAIAWRATVCGGIMAACGVALVGSGTKPVKHLDVQLGVAAERAESGLAEPA